MEEKSKAPLVIRGIVVAAVLGVGSWLVFRPSPTEAETVAQVPGEEVATSTPAGEPSSAPTAQETMAANSGTSGAKAETTAEEGTPTTASARRTSPEPKPGGEWVLPGPGEPIRTRGISRAELIALDQVPAVERWPGSSDTTWAEVQEDLTLFLADEGVRSNRAGNRLADKMPRDAYPAIVNAMMQVDFTTREGVQLGSALNELFLRMGKTDLGWHTVEFLDPDGEEWNKAVTYDKKVVAGWQVRWVNSFRTSDEAWNKFTGNVSATEPPAADSGIIGPEEDPFD